MKNITRLALAFAVAALACLSPMAHADEEAQGIQSVRYYTYGDEDGEGTMVVKDGRQYSWGRPIYVAIYQKGRMFYGMGTRTLASDTTAWYATCEFWVYGSRVSAKFTGWFAVKPPPYGVGGGEYFLNGSGSPHEWTCHLNDD